MSTLSNPLGYALFQETYRNGRIRNPQTGVLVPQQKIGESEVFGIPVIRMKKTGPDSYRVQNFNDRGTVTLNRVG